MLIRWVVPPSQDSSGMKVYSEWFPTNRSWWSWWPADVLGSVAKLVVAGLRYLAQRERQTRESTHSFFKDPLFWGLNLRIDGDFDAYRHHHRKRLRALSLSRKTSCKDLRPGRFCNSNNPSKCQAILHRQLMMQWARASSLSFEWEQEVEKPGVKLIYHVISRNYFSTWTLTKLLKTS